MELTGLLRGLTHDFGRPLNYFLSIAGEHAALNGYLGEHIHLAYQGEMECIFCGRSIKKTFNQGSCYPCFKNRAENDLCIVKPHLCHYDQGTCRDKSFGERHCMKSHIVYIALSSHAKVGITSKSRMMKRWADQGATRAVPLAEVPDRKTAGELEVLLSEHVSDKTDWRKMLQGQESLVDLSELRIELLQHVPLNYQTYMIKDAQPVTLEYPQIQIPERIKSFDLEKLGQIEGRLIGMKGQYLLLETGVMNMKKHAGMHVRFRAG